MSYSPQFQTAPSTIYSTNPGIQATIEALLTLGCPPIPVAPKQDPRKEDCHHQHFAIERFKGANPRQPEIQGNFCRISQTSVGGDKAFVKGDYCRLDENLQPIGRITGKNPSYLGLDGKPRTLNHKSYQDRQPTERELREWFANPNTGVGTLGGHSGVDWLDFDAKNYSSQGECDRAVQTLIDAHGLTTSWIEKTGSGGYRIAVCPQEKPTFTNFATEPNGRHVGEALFEGRFTVLAPTIHPNGNTYERIGWGEPVEVTKLEDIGIYPTQDEKANHERKQKRSQNPTGSKPTDPASNPWDIRNFSEYLIGYRVEGDWINCKCPAHDGVSDNSLHIRVDTGAFHCWQGCDTKRIYREAKAIAAASGYTFPTGVGFGASERDSQNQASRERLISSRKARFMQYWDGLKRDFQLSSVIPGVDRQIEYEGNCPELELYTDTICVSGWLGAGKTEMVLRSLAPFKDERSIVASTPLNGLGRQFEKRAERMGFDARQYQGDVGIHRMMLHADQKTLVIMCPDSFKPYATGELSWSMKTLVIDEFAGIRKGLSSKSEKDEFFRAIAECGQLIVADAFLSDADIALIRKHRSGSIALYRQKAEKSPVKIHWIETRNREGQIAFRHDAVYFELLRNWIGSEVGRIAIAADSITTAKAIKTFAEQLTYPDGRSPRVWIACSETPEENASFMPDPDGIIQSKSQPIDVVVYTPTAKSGLDIQAPFDRGLLISCGVLSPTDMLQMLGRCRKCSEWFVSAPRFADAGQDAPLLDRAKIKRWIGRITESFEELGFNAPKSLQGWGLWESLTKEIERQFNSEYIQALLNEYFESVETVEIDSGSVMEWRSAIAAVKNQDAENTLNGNLENGRRLKAQKKQPSKNSKVWDLKLAEYHEKFPKLAEKNVSDFRELDEKWRSLREQMGYCPSVDLEESRQDSLTLCKIMNSRRAEKLKNWVQAIENNPQDEIDLSDLMRSQKINYNSPAFKARQNIELFRSLGLTQLVKLQSKSREHLVADETAFRAKSPIIGELYEEFQRDRKLRALFPLIECLEDFWSAIKKCLKSFGYQNFGATARVKSEKAHKCGHDSKGNQREAKSEAAYFVGWLLMECSGNAYFQENFELIVEAIRDRVVAEREERRKWRDRADNSPPEYEAAA
ncbi:MAG: bifunctional DNA primase/polymerase [Myxacorys californica WJT36-NPBG1]|jgi:hypothetical protein|nr:bifunctional DNA primase/polymerase [Myxacorys californica WJT36-NPBG1]